MILLKKAVVSMLRNKKAYISCIILIALGVAMYATMNTALLVLEEGKNEYYDEYRLGDAFATVSQIPRSGLQKLAEIEGIKQVDGRLVQNLRVMVENEPDTIYTIHMITTVIGENKNRLNAYKIVEGKDLDQPMDVLVGEDMYLYFGFKPGDKINILINGKGVDFNVSGSIFSPEYVYIVQNVNEMISDNTKYNIGYISEETFMNMTGQNGVYTDLSFEFEDGYDYDMLKDELEAVLKPNDLIALYGRDDLLSYLMFEEEIRGGKSMSTTIPLTFVFMAAIVLYLMLKRIIEQDRAQIGILKAIGYSNTAVLGHYIFYGFVTGSIGAIIGLGISAMVTSPYIDFYLVYYKMPIATTITNYHFFYLGGGIALASGIFGAYLGARSIIKLKPAEAMRPKAPRPIRTDIADLLPFLKKILTARGMMSARNLPRNKVRSIFVIVGITFSYAMMVYAGMMNDMMDSMFYNQFNHVLKYDAEMVLDDSMPYNQAVEEAMSLDDITYAEGILKVPVMIHKGFKSIGANIIGMREDGQLYKIYDDTRKINLQLTDDGMILSSNIAHRIGVEPGDTVTLESPQFKEDIDVIVYEIVQQSVGTTGFMQLSMLSNLMDTEEKVNSVIFAYSDLGMVREQMIDSNQVVKIEDKKETLRFLNELFSSYYFIFYVIEMVAILIGFTIIYNTAVISMSERSREYATLRVIGLRIKEVKEIMSFEYWLLCIMGIAFGVPFAMLMNYGMSQMIDIESFSWPAEVPPIAFVYATVGCILAVYLSNLTSMKTIRHLSLVEVLKERE